MAFPVLRQTVIDCPDAPALAEFYRQLLGFEYPAGRAPDAGDDWVNLRNPAGGPGIAFQQIDDYQAPNWPEPGGPSNCTSTSACPPRRN